MAAEPVAGRQGPEVVIVPHPRVIRPELAGDGELLGDDGLARIAEDLRGTEARQQGRAPAALEAGLHRVTEARIDLQAERRGPKPDGHDDAISRDPAADETLRARMIGQELDAVGLIAFCTDDLLHDSEQAAGMALVEPVEVDVGRGAKLVAFPDDEQHGALDGELVAVTRRRHPADEAFVRPARQHQLRVHAVPTRELAQATPDSLPGMVHDEPLPCTNPLMKAAIPGAMLNRSARSRSLGSEPPPSAYSRRHSSALSSPTVERIRSMSRTVRAGSVTRTRTPQIVRSSTPTSNGNVPRQRTGRMGGHASRGGLQWLGIAIHTFAGLTSPKPCSSAAENRQATPLGMRASTSAIVPPATWGAPARRYVPRETASTVPASTSRRTVLAVMPRATRSLMRQIDPSINNSRNRSASVKTDSRLSRYNLGLKIYL